MAMETVATLAHATGRTLVSKNGKVLHPESDMLHVRGGMWDS